MMKPTLLIRHDHAQPSQPSAMLAKLGELLDLADGELLELSLVIGCHRVMLQITEDAKDCPRLKPARKAWHSPDWREIHLEGQRWNLSLKPAVVVRMLWTAALEGKPDVDQSHLLRKAESDCIRVPDLFRRVPQWDQLIVSIEPSKYRLACADILSDLLEE